jgi:Ca2+ transporting ATPase
MITSKLSEWAERDALRVLAFATVENPKVPAKVDPSQYAKIEVLVYTLLI